jgi:hypothetical protein
MRKLLTLLLLAPVFSFAQTPFDGTWMTKLSTAQFPKKPDEFFLDKGMYQCKTCVPPYTIKADGTDQSVSGHAYYDTVAVRVIDDQSIELSQKKEGKVLYTETDTVSRDGNALTTKFVDSSEAKSVNGELSYTRVGKAAAGSHAISGAWRLDKANNVSENGLTISFQGTENGLKMTDPNGASYDAKFDGKLYPVEGDPGKTMVSLKRIGNDTIEETDQRNGKVASVMRMTVSADGKTIKVVLNDKLRNTTTTWTMEKQ